MVLVTSLLPAFLRRSDGLKSSPLPSPKFPVGLVTSLLPFLRRSDGLKSSPLPSPKFPVGLVTSLSPLSSAAVTVWSRRPSPPPNFPRGFSYLFVACFSSAIVTVWSRRRTVATPPFPPNFPSGFSYLFIPAFLRHSDGLRSSLYRPRPSPNFPRGFSYLFVSYFPSVSVTVWSCRPSPPPTFPVGLVTSLLPAFLRRSDGLKSSP